MHVAVIYADDVACHHVMIREPAEYVPNVSLSVTVRL